MTTFECGLNVTEVVLLVDSLKIVASASGEAGGGSSVAAPATETAMDSSTETSTSVQQRLPVQSLLAPRLANQFATS